MGGSTARPGQSGSLRLEASLWWAGSMGGKHACALPALLLQPPVGCTPLHSNHMLAERPPPWHDPPYSPPHGLPGSCPPGGPASRTRPHLHNLTPPEPHSPHGLHPTWPTPHTATQQPTLSPGGPRRAAPRPTPVQGPWVLAVRLSPPAPEAEARGRSAAAPGAQRPCAHSPRWARPTAT